MKLSQRRLARPSLGGMLATRQGSLTLALICAVCAAGILVFALGRYKTSLKTPVTQASVLVATAEIPKGTAGQQIASQRLYKVAPVAVSQVTPGALSDAASIASETAVTNIMPGQQLTAADFAGVTEVSETLKPDQRAVSVSIGESQGDTDVLQAGDHVDIYQQLPMKSSTPASGAQSSASTASPVLPIITDALVLKPATGVPVKDQGVPITGGSMVLAINADQVQLLIAAVLRGGIYLSLRPANATSTPGSGLTDAFTKASTDLLNTLSKTPNLSSNPSTS